MKFFSIKKQKWYQSSIFLFLVSKATRVKTKKISPTSICGQLGVCHSVTLAAINHQLSPQLDMCLNQFLTHLSKKVCLKKFLYWPGANAIEVYHRYL
jgi:hypothetical protein